MSNFLDVDDSLIARNLFLGGNLSSTEDIGKDIAFSGGGIPNPIGPSILTPSERREQAQCKFIIPYPGLCLKTRELTTGTGQKVFVNLCKSDDVPEPDEYFTDQQIACILSEGGDEELGEIRLPMSIGEKHIEKDKTGNQCPVFDVVINKEFFEKKILVSEMYRTFLMVVMLEGLEEKFKLEFDKQNYVILSQKKSMGKLNPHFVRNKPAIKELKSPKGIELMAPTNPISKKTLVEEIDTEEVQLDCNITQISSDLAKVEIKLPNLKNSKKLSVTLGADRIMVDSPVGSLDIFVPMDIHQEESKAEYNMETSVLSLHLPLVTKP